MSRRMLVAGHHKASATRRSLVAGNWKMNGTLSSGRALAQSIIQAAGSLHDAEIVLCPPLTALTVVAEILRNSPVSLGAQNVYWEPQGAFTGEVSISMLKDAGCQWCIVGHSERRQLLKETDEDVWKKLQALVSNGMKAILCVGETLEARQAGRTWNVVKTQLESSVGRLEPQQIPQVVIAYEPIWAIGTGQNATASQAQEVHASIRSWLKDRFGSQTAESIRIQYGGSVKADNAEELMREPDVDGALVGGASLDAKSFISIVKSALEAKRSKCCTG